MSSWLIRQAPSNGWAWHWDAYFCLRNLPCPILSSQAGGPSLSTRDCPVPGPQAGGQGESSAQEEEPRLLLAELLSCFRRGGCPKEKSPPPSFQGDQQTARASAQWVLRVQSAGTVCRPHGQNQLLLLSRLQILWASSAWGMGVQRSIGFPLAVGLVTTLTLPA